MKQEKQAVVVIENQKILERVFGNTQKTMVVPAVKKSGKSVWKRRGKTGFCNGGTGRLYLFCRKT